MPAKHMHRVGELLVSAQATCEAPDPGLDRLGIMPGG